MSRSNKGALKDHFSCSADNEFSDAFAIVRQRDIGGGDMDKVFREGGRGGQIGETFSEQRIKAGKTE